MKTLQFTVAIHASKDKVWKTLWDDRTFRDWAAYLDEGIYKQGEIKEGNIIQFISGVGGYGVSSLIEKLIPGALISFRHRADTMEYGAREREQEWTGGVEKDVWRIQRKAPFSGGEKLHVD